MKSIYWSMIAFLSALAFCACEEEDATYEEQKEQEREVVQSFINRNVVIKLNDEVLLDMGKVKVLTEEEFEKQGYTTNVQENEYVLFSNTGIYMQIVRQGTGERIKSGESRRLMCRFWEYNIMGDSLQLTNMVPAYATRPEYMNIANNSGYLSGSFDYNSVPTGSLIYSTYGDGNVPDGWLKPLEYVSVGSQVQADQRIAKVRVIVPHGSGHSHAVASVYPCMYELTFQEVKN